jgi:hypothetical protein
VAAGLAADATALLSPAALGGAYPWAYTRGYDEVVDPAALRTALPDALRLSAARRRTPAEPAAHTGILP